MPNSSCMCMNAVSTLLPFDSQLQVYENPAHIVAYWCVWMTHPRCRPLINSCMCVNASCTPPLINSQLYDCAWMLSPLCRPLIDSSMCMNAPPTLLPIDWQVYEYECPTYIVGHWLTVGCVWMPRPCRSWLSDRFISMNALPTFWRGFGDD